MSDPSIGYDMWYHFERDGDTLMMIAGFMTCEQFQRTDEDINAAWDNRKEYEPTDTPRDFHRFDGVYETTDGNRMVITGGGAHIRVSSSVGIYSFSPSSSSPDDIWTNEEVYVVTGDREPYEVGDHQERFSVKLRSGNSLFYDHYESDWVLGKNPHPPDLSFLDTYEEYVPVSETIIHEDCGEYILVYEDPYLQ
jgi:hypothetical protein